MTMIPSLDTLEFDSADRLVLDHDRGAQFEPVATVRPISPLTGAGRRGIIDRRFPCADSTIIAGDRIRCFGMLNPSASISFGGGRPYRIRTVSASDSGAVDDAESAMALSRPVLVQTCIDSVSGEALHWVVADGMTTSWDTTGSGQHRGTYRIHDTMGVGDALVSVPFRNGYLAAELTEPQSPLTEDDEGSLVFSLCGTAVLGVTDPTGHRLVWDEVAGGYHTDISACVVFPAFNISKLSAGVPGDQRHLSFLLCDN